MGCERDDRACLIAFSQYNALPFESGAFEVQNEPHGKTRNLAIIEHLANLVLRDFLDGLGIYNNLVKTNQIRNIFTDNHVLIAHIESWLLSERNLSQSEFNRQRILIRFLPQPVPQHVEHFHRAPDNPMHFIAKSQVRISPRHLWSLPTRLSILPCPIGVNSCPFVVSSPDSSVWAEGCQTQEQ